MVHITCVDDQYTIHIYVKFSVNTFFQWGKFLRKSSELQSPSRRRKTIVAYTTRCQPACLPSFVTKPRQNGTSGCRLVPLELGICSPLRAKLQKPLAAQG
jgi:hypothetical protein